MTLFYRQHFILVSKSVYFKKAFYLKNHPSSKFLFSIKIHFLRCSKNHLSSTQRFKGWRRQKCFPSRFFSKYKITKKKQILKFFPCLIVIPVPKLLTAKKISWNLDASFDFIQNEPKDCFNTYFHLTTISRIN